MPEPRPSDKDFLEQLTSLVEEHLSNEQFGVSELAEAVNMSRSNLLRKVNKLTKLSVSQFIRQIRLQRGMELLRKSAKNVSEVSFEVGFSSTSYFIKCFREYYGYPPGEVGRRMEAGISRKRTGAASRKTPDRQAAPGLGSGYIDRCGGAGRMDLFFVRFRQNFTGPGKVDRRIALSE